VPSVNLRQADDMKDIETMFLRDRLQTATSRRDHAEPLSPEWRSAQRAMNIAAAGLATISILARTKATTTA
jgi:hypothetical protein